jgi:hypothetical protein
VESFNLKKLKEVEGEEQHCVETSNRFPALQNIDTEVDINRDALSPLLFKFALEHVIRRYRKTRWD